MRGAASRPVAVCTARVAFASSSAHSATFCEAFSSRFSSLRWCSSSRNLFWKKQSFCTRALFDTATHYCRLVSTGFFSVPLVFIMKSTRRGLKGKYACVCACLCFCRRVLQARQACSHYLLYPQHLSQLAFPEEAYIGSKANLKGGFWRSTQNRPSKPKTRHDTQPHTNTMKRTPEKKKQKRRNTRESKF